jgi:hypothetical protein
LAPDDRSKGQELARHENEFDAGAEAPLSMEELLSLLGPGSGDNRTREEAIACFLSGSDGWRDAIRTLGGTFAGEATGLKESKAD